MLGVKMKNGARFVIKNVDAFLVLFVAAGVLVYEIKWGSDLNTADSLVIALLGMTSLVLLRDRKGRQDLDKLAEVISDLRSDQPYDVMSEINEWDIRERGSKATFTKLQTLRFTRNRVSVLEHWSSVDQGKVESSAFWRLPGDGDGDGWQQARKGGRVKCRQGAKTVFNLRHEFFTGDRIEWKVVRELKGNFQGKEPTVTLKLDTPSNSPTMKIKWPAERPPKKVFFRREDQPLDDLPTDKEGGRVFAEKKIHGNLPSGAVSAIRWTWSR